MMKNSLFSIFIFLVIVGFIACKDTSKNTSNKPFGNCQFGPPKAIFSKGFPKVESHRFELNAEFAIEKVIFEENLQLELVQSGCEKPKQEFQFTLPIDSKSLTDDDWIDLSLEMFSFMGGLSEDLKPFLMWEGALVEKRESLKLGLPLELESGFFVKLDKVAAENYGIIIIILYRE